MKEIEINLNETIYKSSLLDMYFNGMNVGALDIETTGLDPSRNKFILGGLYGFTEKKAYQVFAEKRSEEANALEIFYKKMSRLDMVITYNGKHFDLPFIRKRMEKQLGYSPAMPYNLDIYLLINGYSPIKKFVPNLQQKTIENYMGFWQHRDDEISGAESVQLYNSYEQSGDPMLEKKILLHNSDDILQLTRLLKVVTKCDFHKAMYHLGYPVGNLTVNRTDISGSTLTLTGIQRKKPFSYIGFFIDDYPVETRFDAKEATFNMKIPIIRQSGVAAIDLDAAGLPRKEFEKYPACSNGFLAIEVRTQKNYMVINHFVKRFLEKFLSNL